MSTKLCIAIPTYNRAFRLRKALIDILKQIDSSVQNKKDVSVFVSNNGSSDNTENVLQEIENTYSEYLIKFNWISAKFNQGFDLNILTCYENNCGEYVMFASDDDNIRDGVIPEVLKDIAHYKPNVLYYNFDQYPWTLETPYLNKTVFFDNFDFENLESLKKIAKWPKLTGIILRSGLSHEVSQSLKDVKLGFMHVALAFEIGISQGRILHSSNFIGRPDPDYLDHIDFPPFVSNGLYETLWLLLSEKQMINLFPSFELRQVDPLTSSLNYLGGYYRGKTKISPELKQLLFKTIKDEMLYIKMNQDNIGLILKAIIKFMVSYIYHLLKRLKIQ